MIIDSLNRICLECRKTEKEGAEFYTGKNTKKCKVCERKRCLAYYHEHSSSLLQKRKKRDLYKGKKRKMVKCLGPNCDAHFLSISLGHRLCPKCRRNWRTGGDYAFPRTFKVDINMRDLTGRESVELYETDEYSEMKEAFKI